MVIIKKIKNTFLTPKFLWKFVIRDYSLSSEKTLKKTFFKRILKRIFRFYPSLHQAGIWHDAEEKKMHGFDNYIEIGGSMQCLMDAVVQATPNLDDPICDLGCNVGRGLNYLAEKGYTNLTGVDIGKAAVENSTKIFPKLKEAKIKHQFMQGFLLEQEDLAYSTTYTHGATFELIPSSFPLIKETARVTKKYICLMIHEDGQTYPRFWEYEFKRNSFALIKKYKYSLDNETKGDLMLLVFNRTKN